MTLEDAPTAQAKSGCALYPVDRWIFAGMLGAIAAQAELEPRPAP